MTSSDEPSLSDAIDDLLGRRTQDPGRLNALADYCIEAFANRDLPGVQGGKAGEAGIRGIARNKDWDLAYLFAGKPRLLISLKSILRNLAGTMPNRLDDLMGEAANVQQYSPEIVTGYVVVVDESESSVRRADDKDWVDFFEESLNKITIRRAPMWNQGLIEAVWVIRIDSKLPKGQRIPDLAGTLAKGETFFQVMMDELQIREPAIFE